MEYQNITLFYNKNEKENLEKIFDISLDKTKTSNYIYQNKTNTGKIEYTFYKITFKNYINGEPTKIFINWYENYLKNPKQQKINDYLYFIKNHKTDNLINTIDLSLITKTEEILKKIYINLNFMLGEYSFVYVPEILKEEEYLNYLNNQQKIFKYLKIKDKQFGFITKSNFRLNYDEHQEEINSFFKKHNIEYPEYYFTNHFKTQTKKLLLYKCGKCQNIHLKEFNLKRINENEKLSDDEENLLNNDREKFYQKYLILKTDLSCNKCNNFNNFKLYNQYKNLNYINENEFSISSFSLRKKNYIVYGKNNIFIKEGKIEKNNTMLIHNLKPENLHPFWKIIFNGKIKHIFDKRSVNSISNNQNFYLLIIHLLIKEKIQISDKNLENLMNYSLIEEKKEDLLNIYQLYFVLKNYGKNLDLNNFFDYHYFDISKFKNRINKLGDNININNYTELFTETIQNNTIKNFINNLLINYNNKIKEFDNIRDSFDSKKRYKKHINTNKYIFTFYFYLFDKFKNKNFIEEILKNHKNVKFISPDYYDNNKEKTLKKYIDLLFKFYDESIIYHNFIKKDFIHSFSSLKDNLKYFNNANKIYNINEIKNMLSLNPDLNLLLNDLYQLNDFIEEKLEIIKYESNSKEKLEFKNNYYEFILPKTNLEIKKWEQKYYIWKNGNIQHTHAISSGQYTLLGIKNIFSDNIDYIIKINNNNNTIIELSGKDQKNKIFLDTLYEFIIEKNMKINFKDKSKMSKKFNNENYISNYYKNNNIKNPIIIEDINYKKEINQKFIKKFTKKEDLNKKLKLLSLEKIYNIFQYNEYKLLEIYFLLNDKNKNKVEDYYKKYVKYQFSNPISNLRNFYNKKNIDIIIDSILNAK